jgi:hypothetical protein
MSSPKAKSGSPEYTSISRHDDGSEDSTTSLEARSSFEDEHSVPLLEYSENPHSLSSSKSSQPPKLILYFSFALALLSAVNVALLPATLSKYQAYPLSDSEIEALPNGDTRLGIDRAEKMIPPPQIYHHAWPDRVVRVGRKLKNAVWGHGVQVYITVEVRVYLCSPLFLQQIVELS